MWGRIESTLARVAVVVILAATSAGVALARAANRILRGRGRRIRPVGGRRVLLVGTFYNDGWFRSHIEPLSRCDAIDRLMLVSDRPLSRDDKIDYCCPSRWLTRLIGRTPARVICVLKTTWRERPTHLVGYHIMPNALICLFAARLFGLQAVYQMTGGPAQVAGGGVGSENRLLRLQRKGSRLRHSLMAHLVRQFDWIIVRGWRALEFVEDLGAGGRCRIIPGAVDVEAFSPSSGHAKYDVVSVGRLVEVKRPERVLEIVARLTETRPGIRAAIVGDGPLLSRLKARAAHLGIGDQVDFLGRRVDVADILRQSRAFILTSDNEGMSIAMMEAMAAGLPVMVPNIGDLGDLVVDGVTGVFIDAGNADRAASVVRGILDDAAGARKMGEAARSAVVRFASVESVARQWWELLEDSHEPMIVAPCARAFPRLAPTTPEAAFAETASGS